MGIDNVLRLILLLSQPMRRLHIFMGTLALVLLSNLAFSQEIEGDTIGDSKTALTQEEIINAHSPKKATLLSVCLPGAGQIYNKKYWKAPIVWVGLGYSIYLSESNRKQQVYWKDQYIRRIDTSLTDDYPGRSTLSLEDLKDTYRKWTELSYVAAGAIYILQIIDANVDAHLLSFDVSDDLSMNVMPEAIRVPSRQKPVMGLTLTLHFK